MTHDDIPHPADLPEEGFDGFRPIPDKGMDRIKLPQSLEAEREVLSAPLVSPKALEAVVGALQPRDFAGERHQLIAGAYLALYEAGRSVDVVTVQQALKDRGQYEKVGAQALGELLNRSGTVTNLEHYIAIVADKAKLRRVIETARAVETQALGDVEDVGGFVEQVGRRWERVIGEAKTPVEPMQLRTLDQRQEAGEPDWLDELPPEAPVLLRRDGKAFMRDSRVAALIAPGGTGKTFVLLDFCAAVATGGKWLGAYDVVHKGKVFLGLGEEDEDEARRRLWHIAQRLDAYDRAELKRNLVVMGLMGEQVAMLQRTADGNVAPTPWFMQLRESLVRHGPWRAIALDPWSRWGGSEAETDAHVATFGISQLESLTKVPGRPAVIVAHHTRKVVAGAKQDASDTRGSSAFVDGARLVANLFRRPTGELLELRVTKANYTMPGAPLIMARGEGGALRPATETELLDEMDGVQTKAVARATTSKLAAQAPKQAWRKDDNTL